MNSEVHVINILVMEDSPAACGFPGFAPASLRVSGGSAAPRRGGAMRCRGNE